MGSDPMVTRASGARPPPGGEVAVFGVVKISCQISPRAASNGWS